MSGDSRFSSSLQLMLCQLGRAPGWYLLVKSVRGTRSSGRSTPAQNMPFSAISWNSVIRTCPPTPPSKYHPRGTNPTDRPDGAGHWPDRPLNPPVSRPADTLASASIGNAAAAPRRTDDWSSRGNKNIPWRARLKCQSPWSTGVKVSPPDRSGPLFRPSATWLPTPYGSNITDYGAA